MMPSSIWEVLNVFQISLLENMKAKTVAVKSKRKQAEEKS